MEEGASLPPEIIEALLEAERLSAAARQAVADERADARRGCRQAGIIEEGNEGDGASAEGDDGPDAATPAATPAATSAGEAALAALTNAAPAHDSAEAAEEALQNRGSIFRRDSARVLAVQPSRVVMYVPGIGVRPFLYSHVFI